MARKGFRQEPKDSFYIPGQEEYPEFRFKWCDKAKEGVRKWQGWEIVDLTKFPKLNPIYNDYPADDTGKQTRITRKGTIVMYITKYQHEQRIKQLQEASGQQKKDKMDKMKEDMERMGIDPVDLDKD